MTTGIGPYVTPDPLDSDLSGTVLETVIVASMQDVDIGLGSGVMANAEVYNGAIPGPTLRLNVGDTVIVRLINDLPHPTGIHWHGIELQNSADGTPVTQHGVREGPFPMPSPLSPSGGTYLYKFKVPRPGIFWYHPHHHHSTNRVFRGLYGMIVVADPNESTLIGLNVIPPAADTMQVVLSDITVCKAPGTNDPATYPDPSSPPPGLLPAEWLSGATVQPGPTPADLCEISPLADDGTPGVPFAAGEVPNIHQASAATRTVEGQTVLTNGMNVGGRQGTPSAPGALDATAVTRSVLAGQGLRLQFVNCATLRYFRLILTTQSGTQLPLVRIGGEGGLLDRALLEGGTIGTHDTKFSPGEILIPPAARADVVVAIPPGEPVGSVLTLWTRDYQRTGPVNPGNWAHLPTVPVMHFQVTGTAGAPYTITGGDGVTGTALRAAIPGAAVETLGPASGALLDPSTFSPAKPGLDIQDIQLTTSAGPSINGTAGSFSGFDPYTSAPHIASTRYAEDGDSLELTLTNTTNAHHPFHLHGFSFQPISIGPTGAAPTYVWTYREFVDVIDLPNGHALTVRVRLDDRELADGLTLGGALGRWLFHCHIFFHAHLGMISELVVTNNAGGVGSEKPNVDVGGSWAYTPAGGIARRGGTYSHPDGDPITLSASLGTVVDMGGGQWSWSIDSTGMPDQVQYVYVTATDAQGRQDQTVFRLKIGGADDGSDSGDPHIYTVDGKRYDFQAAGEFTLLRDREGMELQTRQTPVPTATPITDSYTGLKACVSVNTAFAARVGSHRIAYQPYKQGLIVYVDGKPAELTTLGINLDGHRVTAFATSGAAGLRIDYAHHPVVIVTPHFWSSNKIWYMNVAVSHTQADAGLMGCIHTGTWLPLLPSGASVGPMPQSQYERYVALYKTFANAWRVTDKTSLFVYPPGMSTATFTDEDWPAQKPPCVLKPQFQIPGVVTQANIPLADAKRICQAVTMDDLHDNCVFDVATTGDKAFAKAYLTAQELRRRGTKVQLVGNKMQTRFGEPLLVTAVVLPLFGKSTPTGLVTFYIDDERTKRLARLDKRGRAFLKTQGLRPGKHRIRAEYTSGRKNGPYYGSSSVDLIHTVKKSTSVFVHRSDPLARRTRRRRRSS